MTTLAICCSGCGAVLTQPCAFEAIGATSLSFEVDAGWRWVDRSPGAAVWGYFCPGCPDVPPEPIAAPPGAPPAAQGELFDA